MTHRIRGVIAALLTPRREDGSVDPHALRKNIEFVRGGGVQGICVLGATGEYPGINPVERETILATAQAMLWPGALLLCGVGGYCLRESVERANWALENGADCVLLSTPFFFPYSSEDVEAFYREAFSQIHGPVLIYNLPMFTSPLDPIKALALMDAGGNVAGIKDSSGDLAALRMIRERYGNSRACIVGHDGVLARAIRNDRCHAVISGVAGVCPEIITGLFESGTHSQTADFDRYEFQLACLIEQLADIPTPWGLKWIESRGLFPAEYAIPLSTNRQRQRDEFFGWLDKWLPAALHETDRG